MLHSEIFRHGHFGKDAAALRHLGYPEGNDFVAPSVWMGCPKKTISPERGGTIPEMDIKVVLLPAPLAPISATISPAGTEKLTSLSAMILRKTCGHSSVQASDLLPGRL